MKLDSSMRERCCNILRRQLREKTLFLYTLLYDASHCMMMMMMTRFILDSQNLKNKDDNDKYACSLFNLHNTTLLLCFCPCYSSPETMFITNSVRCTNTPSDLVGRRVIIVTQTSTTNLANKKYKCQISQLCNF